MKVDAILPAGGRIHGGFAEEAGTEVKALIRFGGRTILENIAESARATGLINRIAVIGPESVCIHVEGFADAVLPEADSGPANIFKGLDWLNAQQDPADRILILMTDIPFVTKESISGFVNGCPEEAEMVLPIYTRQEFERRFPNSENTFVRLRDGEWTVGGAYLLARSALERNRARIDALFAARKNPLAMARTLGPMFIVRFLTKRLDVPRLEEHCLKVTGCSAAAIRGCDPSLAFDIDDMNDFNYARAHSDTSPVAARPNP